MKKVLLSLLIVFSALFLTSCLAPTNEKKEVNLEKILADETLNRNLYNEVCFNIYEKGVKYKKPHYLHHKTECYFISIYDYTDKELIEDADELKELIKETDLSIFEDKEFVAYLKKDAKYTGDDEFGVPVYTIDKNDVFSLLPVCRVNDDDAKYCMSTDWKVRGGITEKFIILKQKE